MRKKHLTNLNNIASAVILLLMAVVIFLTGCSDAKTQEREGETLFSGQIAPLLDGMGNHHFEISSEDTLVRRFFDQGIMLTYGFNHAEAERTFRQVTQLEPDNPMAWWGVALVQGPNINMPMMPDAAPVAWEALQKALEFKDNGSQREQEYIDALSKRYAENPPEDRSALDEAYAKAMGELVRKYPDDLDARTLYAEALMDLHPWDYWTKEGEPRSWTPEILEALEYVIDRNPDHPGANHLYIHATEASKEPDKALNSSNRLRYAVPGAGHLVHMPSHTYIRVGLYHEGTLANQRAVESDNEYVTQCRQQGIYPLGYVPHNHHFLWATATLEGREALSMEAAYNTAKHVNLEMMREPGFGTLQHFLVIPLYSSVRFGRWNEILNYPEPDQDLIYPRGVWHYARGLAFTAKEEIETAKAELNKLKAITADEALEEVTIWDINTTKELMEIASRVLEAEIAAKSGEYDEAVSLLQEAIAIEGELAYNEPPDWFFPVRQNLGAILLEAGRPAEAESIYREDLDEFPKNGWSLFGLHQSLAAQGKAAEAQKVKAQFDEAWKHADIELIASRIL